MKKIAPDSIEVKDFGPIAHAKVDLKPMTILVGPCNSGKSSLATLIYALHGIFSGAKNMGARKSPFALHYLEFGAERNNEIGTEFDELWKQTMFSYEHHNNEPTQLSKSLSKWIYSGIEKKGDRIAKEICRCFGYNNYSALIRNEANESCIILGNQYIKTNGFLKHTLNISKDKSVFNVDKTESLYYTWNDRILYLAQDLYKPTKDQNVKKSRRYINMLIIEEVIRSLFNNYCKDAYYLVSSPKVKIQS